jgi:methyl-accepting chemotaxis protein
MFNPTKKAKFSNPNKFKSIIDNNIDNKIVVTQNKILKLHNEINKLNNSFNSKFDLLLGKITEIINSQKHIKNNIIAVKETLNNINNNIDQQKIISDILTQNQQQIAEMLFNGDNSMITIPQDNFTEQNSYYS